LRIPTPDVEYVATSRFGSYDLYDEEEEGERGTEIIVTIKVLPNQNTGIFRTIAMKNKDLLVNMRSVVLTMVGL
jgi:hypothetical protein